MTIFWNNKPYSLSPIKPQPHSEFILKIIKAKLMTIPTTVKSPVSTITGLKVFFSQRPTAIHNSTNTAITP